jgi:integrase
VTFPSFVVDERRSHLERFPLVGPDDLVFKNRDGGRIRSAAFQRTFITACKRVGLGGVTPHDLRHTAVALAIRGGAYLKEIQARAGHSSIQVTLDTCGHLFPGQDEALAARLDELRPRVGPMLAPEGSNVREMRSDQGKLT